MNNQTTYTHEIPTSFCEYLASRLETTRHLYKHTNHHDIAIKALRKAAHNAADGEMGEAPHTAFQIARTKTFEDAMILTSDKGLVITAEDGSEYQITIVKSK